MRIKVALSLAALAICLGVAAIYLDNSNPESRGASVVFPLSSVKSDDTEEQKWRETEWRKAEAEAKKYAQAFGGIEGEPIRMHAVHGSSVRPAVAVRIKGEALLFFPDGNFRRY